MFLFLLSACPGPDTAAPKDTAPVDADNDGTYADVDCDDADPDVHPDAVEACNGKDDDCDGVIDPADAEGAQTWYPDLDGDGFGDDDGEVVACTNPGGAIHDDGDCDDSNAAVNPDADERCNDLDDNCDGRIDPYDSVDADVWYDDEDGDGYGDPADTQTACDQVSGRVADATDCDDTRATVHPGAPETCDGRDNDCDEIVDPASSEDAGTWHLDLDTDGYGDPTVGVTACDHPAGYIEDATDCDDSDAEVHPEAVEWCNDRDDDCDGDVDPDSSADASTWYADVDADSYGDSGVVTVTCDAPAGTSATPGDCDDADGDVHPGAAESCNGLDDDCDGTIDPGSASDATTWYPDSDGDGYGDDGAGAPSCTDPGGRTKIGGDCDDTRADVSPVATETCNGRDDNCDGSTDGADAVGAGTWYADGDGDGYGGAAVSACERPGGSKTTSDDCDDADASVHPGGTETCNGKDDDCDGTIDPDTSLGAPLWRVDADGDGYGSTTATWPACEEPAFASADASDCDDSSADAHPGAVELCWTDIDEDCDGLDTSDPDCAPGTGTIAVASWTGSATFGGALDVVPDVSGDGVADLAAGDPAGDGSVALWSARTGLVSTVTGPSGAALGASVATLPDFDGDGGSELAIGATGESAVYLLPLSGSPSLAGAARFSGGTFGLKVASAGDTDGDGLSDLLIGEPGNTLGGSGAGAAWLVFGGTDAGTLDMSSAAVFVGEYKSDGLVVLGGAGDVDEDGYDDVLLGAPGMDEGGSGAGKLYLWRGPFQPGRWEAGGATTRIAGATGDGVGAAGAGVGDLDGNGAIDLVVGSTGYDGGASNAGAVATFYGPLPAGSMAFADADGIARGSSSGQTTGASLLTAGDLDNDGRDELVVGLVTSTSTSALLWYGGLTGTEGYADRDAALSHGGSALAVGDLDGDGYVDLVGGDSVTDTIYVWAGGPRAEAPHTVDTTVDDDGDGYSEDGGDCDDGHAARHPGATETCDDGGDEDCDGYADRCSESGTLELLDLVSVTNANTKAYGDLGEEVLVVRDMSGDGNPEIAVLDGYSSTIRVWFGPIPEASITDSDADVSITPGGSYDDFAAPLSDAGDLDGDGFHDLAVRAGGETGETWIFRGGPSFAGALTLDAASWHFSGSYMYDRPIAPAAIGDVNGDGVDDFGLGVENDMVPVRSDGGSVSVFFGPLDPGDYSIEDDADLKIYSEWKYEDFGAVVLPAGDLDGDGIADLAVWARETDYYGTDINQTLYVFFGPLDAGELEASNADAWLPTQVDRVEDAVWAADLTGDGIAEVIVASNETQWDVVSFRGVRGGVTADDILVARGTFGMSEPYHAHARAGDVDGDGVNDLVLACTSEYGDDGKVWVVPGPLSGTYSSSALVYAVTTDDSFTWFGQSLSVGDTDGDGFADVVAGARDRLQSAFDSWDSGGFVVVRGGSRGGEVHIPAAVWDPAEDHDGDGVSGEDGDCDDEDAGTWPGATEGCGDPWDEDCDGFAAACVPVGEVTLPEPQRSASLSIDACPPLDLGAVTAHASTSSIYLVDNPLPTWEFIPGYAYDATLSKSSYTDTPTDWTTIHDLDGDGLPELFFGASGSYGANVLRSTDGWVDRGWSTALWRFSSVKNSLFGAAVADGGDLDGDGVGDLLVAATGADEVATDAGAVYVFAADLAAGSHATADAWWTIQGATASYAIGSGLVGLGDLDGDGMDELAYTETRTTSTDLDLTYIWTGDSAGGTSSTADAPVQLVRGTSGTAGVVPWALGDLDDDGLDDVAVGAADWLDSSSGASGRVYAWSGLPTSGPTSDADLIIDAYVWRGAFGTAVNAEVDLDGDGARDLVIGAPQSSGYSVQDRVYLWYGPRTLAGAWSAEDADGLLDGDSDMDSFGVMLTAAGDLDGDGWDDLWVDDDSDAYVLRGGLR